VTSLQPSTIFAPPGIPFLASSPDAGAPGRPPAAAALFGAPLDLTESFRNGAHGGPSAIRVVSDVLETYSPVLDRDLAGLKIVDLGDLALNGLSMSEALQTIANGMTHASQLGKLAVMLGGEHTASLGGFRGIKRVHPEAVILQLDAHLDMRPEYDGEPLTHATWLHHVGLEFGFSVIHQFGLRSGDRTEWARARAQTAWSTTELTLPAEVREQIGSLPVYISVDIDVLDPAHAPGTGCPEPGGVTFRELADFLYALDDLHVVAVDVMEVSPSVDAASITPAAAAKLVREAILLWS
jgi:agmatinase